MQFLAINFSVYKGSQLLSSTLQSVFNHVRRKEKYLFIVSTVLYTKTMISFWDKGKGQDSASTAFIWSLQQFSKIISLGLETISKLRDSSQIKEHSLLYRLNTVFGPGGGGGTPLFGLYGYVPLNRVWFSRSWVLNRVYNFTIKRLERVSFWTGSLSKTAETCDEWFTFAIPIIFFLNVYLGRGLKVSEAQLYPDFPWMPPPGISLSLWINSRELLTRHAMYWAVMPEASSSSKQ